MVVGTGRSRDLPAIIDRLVKMSAAEGNKEVAEVRSAVALTDDQKSRLAAALGQATGQQVEGQVVIDPTILGRLGPQVSDTAIAESVTAKPAQTQTGYYR